MAGLKMTNQWRETSPGSIEEKETLQLGPRINQIAIKKRIVYTFLV